MRILLHIGSPKTGTTTLQHALARRRSELLREGYLYPAVEGEANHHLLSLYARPEHPPRIFTQGARKPDTKKLRARGEMALRAIEQQVGEHAPHTLVLSSETLFESRKHSDGGTRIVDRLRRLSEDIHVVCYLRDPVDYALSHLGQTLKATHVLPARLAPPDYVSALDIFRNAPNIHVRLYDRTSLNGGNVVADFWSGFLQRAAAATDDDDRNVSLSAEGIDILWSYRRLFLADQHGKFTADSKALLRELIAAELSIPGRRKLTAQPHIEGAIRHAFVPQAEEIHHRYQVDFAAPSSPAPSYMQGSEIRSPGDVYIVDPARRERMTLEILRRKII